MSIIKENLIRVLKEKGLKTKGNFVKEVKIPVRGSDGSPGKDGISIVGSQGPQGQRGEDGKTPTKEEIRHIVEEVVRSQPQTFRKGGGEVSLWWP